MAERLNQLKNQITSTFRGSRSSLLDKHPDDVVIVSELRTAITRAGKGGFKDSFPEDMLAGILQVHSLFSCATLTFRVSSKHPELIPL